jgi:hypothetical protein
MNPHPHAAQPSKGEPASSMPIVLNPLLWIEGEPSHIARLLGGRASTASDVIDFLRGPFARTSFAELQGRYREVSTFDRSLPALPGHPTVWTNIVVPLHNAKVAYMLGHYLSCIALGATVAEMLAIFRFEIAPQKSKRGLTDDAFEHLGQEERLEKLREAALIDPRCEGLFGEVLGRRRRYMHFIRRDDRQSKGDAKAVYRLAVQLTSIVFGVEIRDRRFGFHEDVDRMMVAALKAGDLRALRLR